MDLQSIRVGLSRRSHAALHAGLALGLFAAAVPPMALADRPSDDLETRHCHFVDPVYDIPRLWGFMAAFDFDENGVNPAVIDIGILNDGMVQDGGQFCDVTYAFSQFVPANFACGAGAGGLYTGVLPGRARHGTNMKNIIAATLNDGDDAGIAGQVAVPNLYAFDEVHNYVFEMDATIDRAVADGATSINISGAFPCAWKTALPSSTFDICTIEGRAAAAAPLCAVAATTGPAAVASTTLCAATAGSIIAEGDIRDRIGGAVARAVVAGVPIVASAGNVETGLSGILSGAVPGNADTLTWSILPATASGVISVGAVDPDPPYGNFDFHGADVDVWAPLNDTSPAAAFVSGLIALAQAINPDLNPATAESTPPIAGTLRNHLVDTAYTNTELANAGHGDPSGLRGNLVNPYRFIRAVSEGVVPDYRALGYPEHFDSWVDEGLNGNDGRPGGSACNAVQVANDVPDNMTDAETIQVMVGQTTELGGAILFFDGNSQVVDEDWYALIYNGLAPSGQHRTVVELRYLAGFGELELTAPSGLLTLESNQQDGAEQVKRYVTGPMLGDARLPFKVAGVTDEDDNLYRLSISQADPVLVKPDAYEWPIPNTSPQFATVIDPGAMPTGITAAGPGINIAVPAANIHARGDADNYKIVGFDWPIGDFADGVRFSVDASTPDVKLWLRTLNGGLIGAGEGSIEAVRPQGEDFWIEVKSRHAGLFAAYGLAIRVEREPLDLAGEAVDALVIELAQFIEQMDHRQPFGGRVPEVGCVTCNILRGEGTLGPAPGGPNGEHRGGAVTRFISVGEPSRLVLTGKASMDAASIGVVDRNMQRVVGKAGPEGLVFEIAPGPHALQWRTARSTGRLDYRVEPSR